MKHSVVPALFCAALAVACAQAPAPVASPEAPVPAAAHLVVVPETSPAPASPPEAAARGEEALPPAASAPPETMALPVAERAMNPPPLSLPAEVPAPGGVAEEPAESPAPSLSGDDGALASVEPAPSVLEEESPDEAGDEAFDEGPGDESPYVVLEEVAPDPSAVEELGEAEEAPLPSSSGEEEKADAARASPFHPLPDRKEVRAVVEQFSGSHRPAVQRGIDRSSRYLSMIFGVLDEMDLPADIAWLPLVESNFHPRARSRAGAVGLWQFMAATARASGLRVDWWVDERLDPWLSTRAAARHLKELYDRFGDWELVLAAYNAGSGGVGRAMAATGAEDFWGLCDTRKIRAETKRYVPKFYAALAILAEPARLGFTPPAPSDAPDPDVVWVDTPVDLATAARLVGSDREILRELNPALIRDCTPPGLSRYPLRLPPGTALRFEQEWARLAPTERLDFARHTVRTGDSLWTISRRYATSIDSIKSLNHISDPRRLRPGQEIVIPVPRGGGGAGGDYAGTAGAGEVHVVRRGDTLSSIGRARGVQVGDLIRWNGLSGDGRILPGQRLALSDSAGTPPSRRPEAATAKTAKKTKSADVSDIHVVRAGETAWSIARLAGVDLSDLLRWNDLDGRARLHPGDRLRIGPRAD